MWYIILSCIIWIIILILVALRYDEDVGSAIITIVTFILLFAPAINLAIGVQSEEQYEETIYEITGLELHNSVEEQLSGAFILGTGAVQGETSTKLKYVFFSNTQYGKKMEIIDGTNVYIRETDEETPKLKVIKSRRYKNPNWLDKLWDSKQTKIEFGTIEHGKILVVPTNTIKIDYNVEI